MSAESEARDLGDRVRAALAELIDRQMSPLGLEAMDALAPAPGETILDIGCGAGQTLLQLADRVGETGRVIGVDVGPHVLAKARAATDSLLQVRLLLQDAARLDLPAGSLDGVYSRFGVMFFAEPIAAFSNIRRMLRSGGRLAFVCWRSVAENELDRLPLHAAGQGFEVDDAPFSFADSETITSVLLAAGFGAIAVRPFDTQVSCGELEQTLTVLTSVGALGKVLREAPEKRSLVEPRVRDALARGAATAEVHLGAATWIVTAVA